ncbi:MAG: hypothetical protein JXB29_09165 [Sedimentisphaerales bacterium]|nr:hypothetical protein [Sedimentisphaerales bacterium]
MNRRQKVIIRDSFIIIAITVITVVAMINLRAHVNHSEAMRAMEDLARNVMEYKSQHGLVPPESYVLSIRDDLLGHVRLTNLQYRARWIDLDCTADEILAYSERNLHSLFLGHGFIVLRLDGRVEWIDKDEFQEILSQQQSPDEIQMLQD